MTRPKAATGDHDQPPPTAAAYEPQYLTVAEVAEILRTTPTAIYAMTARGQLPGVLKIGRRTLVDREDLLEWLTTKRAVSPMEHRR